MYTHILYTHTPTHTHAHSHIVHTHTHPHTRTPTYCTHTYCTHTLYTHTYIVHTHILYINSGPNIVLPKYSLLILLPTHMQLIRYLALADLHFLLQWSWIYEVVVYVFLLYAYVVHRFRICPFTCTWERMNSLKINNDASMILRWNYSKLKLTVQCTVTLLDILTIKASHLPHREIWVLLLKHTRNQDGLVIKTGSLLRLIRY